MDTPFDKYAAMEKFHSESYKGRLLIFLKNRKILLGIAISLVFALGLSVVEPHIKPSESEMWIVLGCLSVLIWAGGIFGVFVGASEVFYGRWSQTPKASRFFLIVLPLLAAAYSTSQQIFNGLGQSDLVTVSFWVFMASNLLLLVAVLPYIIRERREFRRWKREHHVG